MAKTDSIQSPVRQIVTIDGARTQFEAPDIDGDGKINEIETLRQQYATTQSVVQPSDLKESLQELNNDNVDADKRMSGIDMRARLSYIEVPSVMAIDCLVYLKVLPRICLAVSRQKKRLSVSLDGKGREEIVQLVAGKRDLEGRTGMFGNFGDRFKNFFGMPPNNQG